MTTQHVSVPPCIHCGQPSHEPVVSDEKVFCCNGCLRVHELLDGNACELREDLSTDRSYAYLDLDEYRDTYIRKDSEGHSRIVLFLPDMNCASCVQFLEHLHLKNEAILRSEVNFPRKEIRILFDDQGISPGELATMLAASGYPPEVRENDSSKKRKKDYSLVTKIGVAGFCFGNIMLMSFPEYLGAGHLEESFKSAFGWLNLVLSIPVVLYSGRSYVTSAFLAFKNKTINIDVPITIGIFALFLRSTWEVVSGYGIGYFDSLAGLIFFLLIGKWYQARTFGALSYERDYKSYFPIAVLKKEGEGTRFTPISDLMTGDEIIIHHKEIIPADCVLLAGEGRIDYSFVTGEADLIKVSVGEEIKAGGRQTGASITAVVQQPVEQSKLTRLWNSDTFSKEAGKRLEDPVNRISKHFTWVVISIAAIAFIYWFPKDEATAWHALTATLIVACPCALALTIPFTFGSTMRLMGKAGMYLKNTSVIETMSKVVHLVFDKTGTLTRASDYKVTWNGRSLGDEELQALRGVASQSAHPLSRAIASGKIDGSVMVKSFSEATGKGIEGIVDTRKIRLGSSSWLHAPANEESGSQVHVEIDGEYAGFFAFEKPLRDGLDHELNALRTNYNLYLLSGDNSSDKSRFVTYFGADRMNFNQEPEDKMNFVSDLKKRGHTAMIGDGLNDAGALKAADLGVAVVDDLYAFSPACDAILHAGVLKKLDAFLAYSRGALTTVKQSFAISFFYNAIGISFAVQGLLTPLVAAILMPLSSVTVVLFTVISSHYRARKLGLTGKSANL